MDQKVMDLLSTISQTLETMQIRLDAQATQIDQQNETIARMHLENKGKVAELPTTANDLVDNGEREGPLVDLSDGDNNNSANVRAVRPIQRKLYDLPEFSGSPTEWQMFISNFEESTKLYGYTQQENLFRLQKSLKGTARETVKAMLIFPHCIDDAIEELRFRFGRPEILVRDQLEKLQQLPVIGESKVKMLTNYSIQVRNAVALVESSKCDHHLTNSLLLEELIRKLPPTKQYEWGRHAVGIKPFITIKHFSEWLSDIARVLVMLPAAGAESKNHDEKRLLNVNVSGDKSNMKCFLCRSEHPVRECPSFQEKGIEERRQIVKDRKLCFNCLGKGHMASKCLKSKTCGKDGCQRRHHPLLHVTNERVMSCSTRSSSRFFKILPVTVYGPNGRVSTFAMFDEGSSISIVQENIAEKLGLKGRFEPLTLQWYGRNKNTERSMKVNMEIASKHQELRYQLKAIRTVKNLDLPTQSFFKGEFAHLKECAIEDYQDAKPTILLGLDNAFLGVSMRTVDVDKPMATETRLGWVVFGPAEANEGDYPRVMCTHQNQKNDELQKIVEDYLNSENFGFNDIKDLPKSDEDKRAGESLKCTTKRVDGRWETGLLWRQYPPEFPESYNMAKKRLQNIEKKMIADKRFGERYYMEMEKYFQKGYARVLKDDEIQENQNVWYLPHFPVINPKKPEKFRIVFDAAAAVETTSLNSQLMRGPEQAKPLLSLLFQFREHKIGVAADIREMFSQVRIRHEDQNAQRFLWRQQGINSPIAHCVMEAMIFGAACSPCSAEYVKNTNASEFSEEYPEAVNAIINKHYVDDLVCSFDKEENAIRVCQEIVKIHEKGGFELRNFVSNSAKLTATMNGSASKTNFVDLERQAEIEKVLGMQWNVNEDVFQFRTEFHRVPKQVLEGSRSPTKRELLAILMSVFDPYGLVADYLVFSKILVQRTWQLGLKWDEALPSDLYDEWLTWWQQFGKIKDFKVSRYYSPLLEGADRIELHIFVDASQCAFAAAGYLRIIKNAEVNVSFVMGKTRTAPSKLMSIPRLELQAAVLGLRLYKIIAKGHELKISRVIFWSDSRTVIFWLHSSKRKYKAFVAHRIAEILSSSDPEQWRWVPTNMNPADVATRPRKDLQFDINNCWIKRPQFLQQSEEYWPSNSVAMTDEADNEEIQISLKIQASCNIFDFNKFASYFKLKRMVAQVIRATQLFRGRRQKANSNWLTALELRKAEEVILQITQAECFESEIEALKKGRPISKDSEIRTLNPYLDEAGLLRVGGRIDAAVCLPLDARRPIILGRKHIVAELIVSHHHERLHHQNDAVVINEVRLKFWVPRIKSVLRLVKRKCTKCELAKAVPSTPLMGQLPMDRVTPYVRPFTYTGVDLFGPINVAIGRRREKRWGVIFTCLTIRAAHIEIAENLSSDAFVVCLRNFINRRGTPTKIKCDNGTNFVGAKKELKLSEHILDVDRIQDEAAKRNIEWQFNCPANPSSGGCWERLIRIVKRALMVMLKEAVPRLETLRCALIEAENIINSRPLTEIPLSSEDENPLTPNHFLIGCSNSTQTPFPPDDKLCLKKQWRIAQNLKNHFWKRWTTEYLPQLIRRPKWHEKVNPIKIDDLVIVCDPSLTRIQWKKGRVVRVFPAKDGQVRFAEVKTSDGVIRRPASRIAVLSIGKSYDDLRGEEC